MIIILIVQVCLELFPIGERAFEQLWTVPRCQRHLHCARRYEGDYCRYMKVVMLILLIDNVCQNVMCKTFIQSNVKGFVNIDRNRT